MYITVHYIVAISPSLIHNLPLKKDTFKFYSCSYTVSLSSTNNIHFFIYMHLAVGAWRSIYEFHDMWQDDTSRPQPRNEQRTTRWRNVLTSCRSLGKYLRTELQTNELSSTRAAVAAAAPQSVGWAQRVCAHQSALWPCSHSHTDSAAKQPAVSAQQNNYSTFNLASFEHQACSLFAAIISWYLTSHPDQLSLLVSFLFLVSFPTCT